jgi:hypothetical protein
MPPVGSDLLKRSLSEVAATTFGAAFFTGFFAGFAGAFLTGATVFGFTTGFGLATTLGLATTFGLYNFRFRSPCLNLDHCPCALQ